MSATAAAETPKKDGVLNVTGTKKLSIKDFRLAEQVRNTWRITAQAGITPEDMMKPIFWNHISEKLRMGDKIECLSHDASFYCEFLVLYSDALSAAVEPILVRDLTKGRARASDHANGQNPNAGYAVKLRGIHKWSIIREEDNVVLRENIGTRAQAEQELADYLRALRN